MMDRRVFPAMLGALAIGVLADRALEVPRGVKIVGMLVCLLTARGLGCGPQGLTTRGRRSVRAWILLGAVVCFGGIMFQMRCRDVPRDHLLRFCRSRDLPCRVTIRGVAISSWHPGATFEWELNGAAAGPAEDRGRFLLQSQSILLGGHWRQVTGRVCVWVTAGKNGVVGGDLLQVSGQFEPLGTVMNPGQSTWRRRGIGGDICGHVSVPTSELVVHQSGSNWRGGRWRWQLARRAENRLGRYFVGQHHALIAAMLLGRRDGLSDSTRQDFARTGTSHLLCVSGLHVGIVSAAGLYLARGKLTPFRPSLIVVAAALAVYLVITPAQTPVVRATVLLQLLCLAWGLRRRYDIVNALSAVGVLVLSVWPGELFRPGTQLSFLAVVVLAHAALLRPKRRRTDPLDRLVWRSRPACYRFVVQSAMASWDGLRTSALVWVVTLPLVVDSFHLLTPAAVLLNVLLSLPLAIALVGGWLTLLLDLCGAPWAWGPAFVSNIAVHCLIWVTKCVASQHWTYGYIASPGPVAVGLFYVALGYGVWGGLTRATRIWTIVSATVTLMAVWGWHLAGPYRVEHVEGAFLSVGHGCCVVLRFPGGETWLYDAGRMGGTKSGTELVSRYLWSLGITHVDRFLLTHEDLDHYSLMPTLAERFRPRQFITARPPDFVTRPAMNQIVRILRSIGATVVWVDSGDRCRVGRAVIEVLHPHQTWVEGSDNANSLVLRLRVQGRSVLLTGDLEEAGMDRLLELRPQSHDLVMLPHHGSLQSQPCRFVAWSRPQFVVVSGGDDHGWLSLKRMNCFHARSLYHTARHGAVEFDIAPSGVRLRPYREFDN